MKWALAGRLAAGLVLALAPAAFAAGHDIDCKDCHSVHNAKGAFIFSVQPFSGQTATGAAIKPDQIDALCLGCHNEETGIIPIDLKHSHPTGVQPGRIKVPDKLMRNGLFTCVGCHDPHPSNANYKYLIVDTNEGKDMGVFCAKCHPAQSDPDVLAKAEKASVTADPAQLSKPASAAPAPAAAPAATATAPAAADQKPVIKPAPKKQ